MWIIPKVGQRVKISAEFWDKYSAYCYSSSRMLPDWYDRCNKDGGWVVALVKYYNTTIFNSIARISLVFECLDKVDGWPPSFQLIRDTGAFYAFVTGPAMFEPFAVSLDSIHKCPICGSCGTPMMHRFYCTCSECQNYEYGELDKLGRR